MKYTVKKIISDTSIEKKEGKFISDKDIKIYNKNVDIYKEDGSLLLKFRKNVLSDKDTSLLFNNLKGVATLGATRPNASGIPKEGKYKYIKSKSTGKKLRVLTTKARSGIVGFYDTVSNFGQIRSKSISKRIKCRTTAFTNKHMHKFKECLPVFKKIDRIYKKLVPTHYKYQKSQIKKINKKYTIPDTIFTTVTVNKNFRTALHKDSGDLKDSFGNLVICSEGEYEGGYTLFPQYGVGFDLRTGDFLAMDVHEWHCNTEMYETAEDKEFNKKLPKIYFDDPSTGTLGGEKPFTRISFVCYLREKLRGCKESETKKYYKSIDFDPEKGPKMSGKTRKKKREE